MRSFSLAPMSPGLRILTFVCFIVPLAQLYGALVSPPPVRAVLWASFAFVALIYASVWFVFRPTRFEVDGEGLRIVWPVRVRTIEARRIAAVRRISGDELRREYGYGMRIGAGGLWGGFGLLRTGRETFSMWISRLDDLVILSLTEGRPLLITPEEPAKFVEAIRRHLQHR
jgi:hypothetical protein